MTHANQVVPRRADPVAAAREIAAAAAQDGLALRVTGGVAIALRCPSSWKEPLRRPYADVDLAASGSDRQRVVRLLVELGYRPDREFNALHGARRLLFWDTANERQIDVFLDRVDMCHSIDLRPRLQVPGPTLPLADLLLLKLQIVETNKKDLTDIVSLLADHPLGQHGSGIDLSYLTKLVAADWGLWRTLTMIAQRTSSFTTELEGFEAGASVRSKLAELVDAFEQTPKTLQWRLRARLGDRVRWYELPESAQ